MTLAVVVLLSTPWDAELVTRGLSAVLRSGSGDAAVVERPPDALLGMQFLADSADARAWWETAAAAAAAEWLMVIEDDPGLAAEIDGVASTWVVWCRDTSRAALYDRVPNTLAIVANDVGDFLQALASRLEHDQHFARFLRPTWGPFRREAAGRLARDVTVGAGAHEPGETQLRGSRVDVASGVGTPPARTAPSIIGPPPVDAGVAAERKHAGDHHPAPALEPSDGLSAPGVRRDLGERDPGALRAAASSVPRALPRPRASVPPPPPVGVVAVPAVPVPPTFGRASVPAPPEHIVEPRSPAPVVGTTDRPPASETPPTTHPGTSVEGASPTIIDGSGPGEASPSPGPVGSPARLPGGWTVPPVALTGEPSAADDLSLDREPQEIADLVASNTAPLDRLPVLEPPADVADVAGRTPRQVGLFAVPSSWGRRLRNRPSRNAPGGDGRQARAAARVANSSTQARDIADMSEAELRADAARLLMLGPPLVVVCCSRKGGVGKTYDVLGIAELAEEAGEAFAVHSVLLEQNLENPDLRVVLGLPDATPTVRQLDRALADGMEAPGAAHPTQSVLSVYVEERETGSYPRESIERIAQHCRARYGLTAVDLANCLPDVTGGKAAAVVAHWLRHADVVMMPTDASRSGLKGLAEMIDAVRAQARDAAVSAPGMVIPFLVQPGGKALSYPGIAEILQRYDGQGAQPVAVPFSEETQLAGWEDGEGQRTTIFDDAVVRLSYWRLLLAVLRARSARGVR